MLSQLAHPHITQHHGSFIGTQRSWLSVVFLAVSGFRLQQQAPLKLTLFAAPPAAAAAGADSDDEEQLNILMEYAANGSLHARIRVREGLRLAGRRTSQQVAACSSSHCLLYCSHSSCKCSMPTLRVP